MLALGALRAEPRITEAFRTGAGMAWHEHDDDVFLGCELLFRPGYTANLVASWLPALDGVEDKLRAGGRVADVGCGLGSSSVLLAQAYPRATVSASDYHEDSVGLARKRVAEAGVADRVSVETAGAQAFSGTGYDLVATFDCLHDMGDPLGAARHIRAALAADGTWMVVEPRAGDPVADNPQPGRSRLLRLLDVPLRAQRPAPSPAATASAPRPVRPPSGRSPRTPGSPGSAHGRPEREPDRSHSVAVRPTDRHA